MSARIPSRRLGQSAFAAFFPRSSQWTPSTSLPTATQRNVSHQSKPREGKAKTSTMGEDLTNPTLEEYLRKKEIEEGVAGPNNHRKVETPQLRQGHMNRDENSLFAPEREIPGWNPALPQREQAELKKRAGARLAAAEAAKEQERVAMNLDPDPIARRKLEARLVLRSVKRHGRLTKADTLKRTERQSVYRSHDLPTSTKKLQKVVNQIAGKTVSEALVQLRFSKKRIARDVVKGLEIAQNKAIATRGMGLGGGKRAQQRWENQRNQAELPFREKVSKAVVEKENAAQAGQLKSGLIELKDGSKKMVRDPSEIYIDQAWVGKGEMWKTLEHRARGRTNYLKHRTTSFTVLLKEEKTRMRISDEIKKKRDNRKLWTALPDRPVTAQRQYCLW